MERPGQLVKGNADYFMKIAEELHKSDDSFQLLTLSEVVELVNQQLEPQSAEVVTRRLIGQLLTDIAYQMEIEESQVVEILRAAPGELAYVKLEGQRYAVNTMAKALGKSDRWVATRVAAYSQYRAPKLSGYMKYHQEVFDSLSMQAEEVDKLPFADDTVFSAEALGSKLERSGFWVRNQKERLGIPGKRMINPANFASATYYTDADFELFQAEIDREQQRLIATDRDIPLNRLAAAVKHGDHWVLKRLPFISYEPVEKVNPASPSREMTTYYPSPETEEALLALPADILKVRKAA